MNHHPKFRKLKEFFRALGKVTNIYVRRRFAGGRVLRPWIDNRGWLTPAFREQLCLIVTLNNHCVG